MVSSMVSKWCGMDFTTIHRFLRHPNDQLLQSMTRHGKAPVLPTDRDVANM